MRDGFTCDVWRFLPESEALIRAIGEDLKKRLES
jgi:hypothetical protein